MTKIIRRKVTPVLLGIVILSLIVFAIFGKEIFFVEHSNLDISNGEIKFKKVQELEPRIVLFYLVILVFTIVIFFRAVFWKLEYNDTSFSVKNEGIQELEYKKIVSIVHYKAYRYRHSINEFIINYMGESEFGYGEELKKAIIKYYTHNAKMKEFFSFVKEKNPNIDFHSENAACDGIDTKEFDYFVDKCQKLDYGI